MTASSGRVLQMRLVVEADDYAEAVRFYRDVLGAAEELQVHGDGGERVTILDVGRATLEISSPEQVFNFETCSGSDLGAYFQFLHLRVPAVVGT